MDKPQKTIEEKLLKQLKILNFWITTFGVLLLVALGIIGFFMYQTAMFVKSTSDNFSNFQESTSQKLDVKTQMCQGNDQVSQLLKSSGYC